MNCKTIFIFVISILYVCPSPFVNDLLAEKTRYCGDILRITISRLCHGQYASPDKKSFGYDLDYNEYEGDYDVKDNTDLEFPFLSKAVAKTLIPQKMRRGIQHECCKKPCSLQEMSYYCAKKNSPNNRDADMIMIGTI